MAEQEDEQPRLELDGEPTPPKRAGRPGRRVTRENFYEVLDYFSKDAALNYDYYSSSKYYDEHQRINLIKKNAPAYFEIPESVEAQIASLEERLINDNDLDDKISIERSLEKWRSMEAKPLLEEHIATLQAWVHKNVPQTLWTTFKNGLRQKRYKHKHRYENRIHKMDVRQDTYYEMRHLKRLMDAPDWESVFQRMLADTRSSLKKEGKI